MTDILQTEDNNSSSGLGVVLFGRTTSPATVILLDRHGEAKSDIKHPAAGEEKVRGANMTPPAALTTPRDPTAAPLLHVV